MGKSKPTYLAITDLISPSKTLLTPKTSQESLEQITSTKTHLSEIQRYLYSVVDAFHDNPSILNRMATAWGNRPIWHKVIGGMLMFGILFTIGIIAHLLSMILMVGLLATLFVVTSYLLDEHHRTMKRSREGLKTGVLALAKVLELTITALDKIREQLALEIDKFKQENHEFSVTLTKLDQEINLLNEELKHLSTTKEDLCRIKDKFIELSQVNDALNKEMGLKVDELARVKSAMSLEIKKLTDVSGVLQGTVETLLSSVLNDEATRAVIRDKMNDFIKDKSRRFDELADRICQAERDRDQCRVELATIQAALATTQVALDQSHECYKALLVRHEAGIEKLEKIGEKENNSQLSNLWMSFYKLHEEYVIPDINSSTVPVLN